LKFLPALHGLAPVQAANQALESMPDVGVDASGFVQTACWQRGYSGFDSALYRTIEAKWHFSQENAAPRDLEMSTCESKPL
jgi:hypothetical protein